jgi:type IV secretion system protein VirB3
MSRQTDICFVAMTRPSMKWGVPFEGLCANIAFSTTLATAVFGNPLYWSIGLAVHMVMRAKTAKDPHFAHLWRLYFETKMRSLTRHIWGGSRLQPSPTWATRPSEMTASV